MYMLFLPEGQREACGPSFGNRGAVDSKVPSIFAVRGFYVPAHVPLQQVCGTGVGDVECWRVLAAYSSTLQMEAEYPCETLVAV